MRAAIVVIVLASVVLGIFVFRPEHERWKHGANPEFARTIIGSERERYRVNIRERHDPAAYVRDIQLLDPSFCPLSFQVAWFDFVTACRERSDYGALVVLEEPNISAPPDTHPQAMLTPLEALRRVYALPFLREK
jgi:hypothetical protein